MPPAKRPAHPVRTCVGCRQRAAKADLLRVVLDERGTGREVVPDPGGRLPGRGAHLHPTADCLHQALKRRAFTRALRAEAGCSSAPVEEHVRQLAEQQHRWAQPALQHPSSAEKEPEQSS